MAELAGVLDESSPARDLSHVPAMTHPLDADPITALIEANERLIVSNGAVLDAIAGLTAKVDKLATSEGLTAIVGPLLDEYGNNPIVKMLGPTVRNMLAKMTEGKN